MAKTIFEKMGGTYTQVGIICSPIWNCPKNSYLAGIDRQAEEMFSRLVKQIAKAEGVTEQLKADNQMEWVDRMNNIRNRAMEVVNAKLIYTV